jgi:hypothetical protein
MIYLATITTLCNTSKADAKETVLEIGKGLVWLFEIEFPAGCSGLMKVQIFDGLYQVFPATPDEAIRGDNIVVSYDDLYLKLAAPFELKIKTWNEDEVHDHTVQVRVGVATQEAFMSRYMPSVTWDKFEKVLAQVAAEQEREKAAAVEKFIKEVGGEEGG